MTAFSLMTAAAVWGKVWTVLIAIIFFGVMIAVHELGHFLFAKLFKVRVNEFSIGMGPAIIKRKRGETEYALRVIPMGGYCSMEGEDEDSEDEAAFNNKKPWKRFIILAAGAIFNVILGVIIIIILMAQQDLIGTNRVIKVEPNSASATAGIEVGDRITHVNGRKIISFDDFDFLMARDRDGVVDYTVDRNGEKVNITGVDYMVKGEDGTEKFVYGDMVFKGNEPTFISVITNSCRETVSYVRIIWLSLFDLVTGRYSVKEISGPIGAVNYLAQATEVSQQRADLTPVLTIMALITINIGVFNLLPVPALDGGRLFFVLIEMIFRRRVPKKYEAWVHAAGMIILLSFMALISLKDIISLIKG